MTDVIRQDDAVSRRVERLAGAKQLARKYAPDELRARAAGAVHHERSVPHHALRFFLRLAEGAVVHLQLGSVSPDAKWKSWMT